MKLVKYKLILICLLGVIMVFCTKKQDYEILAPETPVYNICGRVVSSAFNKVIANVNISLTSITEVKYNDEDSSRMLSLQQVTDEDGNFVFKDVPGGYGYSFDAEKEGWLSYSQTIVLSYEDKDLEDITLGKYLVWQNSAFIVYHHISGIMLKNGNVWIADTLNRTIAELNENLTINKSININEFTPSGLTWDDQYFWSSDFLNETVLKFELYGNNYINYAGTYPLPKNLYHPEDAVKLLDMCWLSGEIWACSEQLGSKYFKFNPEEPEAINYFDSPDYIKGLSIDSTKIYILSQHSEKEKPALYLLDKNTKEELGYYVIPGDAGLLAVNSDYLWVAKDNRITKYSFE